MAKRKTRRSSNATPTTESAPALPQAPARRPMWHYWLWVILLGAWAMVVASLASYDPADPPAYAAAPANEVASNWVGPVGARVASELYLMLGPGAWLVVAGCLPLILLHALGRPRRHPVMRLTGLLVVAVALTSLIAPHLPPLLPSFMDRPEGPGGLLAIWINRELGLRFATLGTVTILLIATWIGLWMAMDPIMYAAGRMLARNLAAAGEAGTALADTGAVAPEPAAQENVAPAAGLIGEKKSAAPAESAQTASPATSVTGDTTAEDAECVAECEGSAAAEVSAAAEASVEPSTMTRLAEAARHAGGRLSARFSALLRALDPTEDEAAYDAAVQQAQTYQAVATYIPVAPAQPMAADPTSAAQQPRAVAPAVAPAASAAPAVAPAVAYPPAMPVAAIRTPAPAQDAEDGDGDADAPAAFVADRSDDDPISEELRAKIGKLPLNMAAPVRTPSPSNGSLQTVDLSGYQFPTLDLLEEPEDSYNAEQEAIVREQAVALEGALQQYKVQGEVVGIDSGPVITMFEVRLAPGTRVSSVSGIDSDIARALKAHNIRIVPNMAGKDTIGIEVPNIMKEKVRLRELMTTNAEQTRKMALPMWLGKDASGNPLVQDLASMPHMLIAGTTGSGKSVCMNSIIMSFLYTRRPDELKLVLVDPKMVEMSMYKDIPHLMCPVVTEMAKATAILEWAVTKMDERYELLAEAGVRDIATYNALSPEELIERFQPATPQEEMMIPKKLPYMVFVIDELADLMMTNKEVEGFIVRIAQKARAVGMHLILATQRPQANVVTGLIKGNMPCRVAFKVASRLDSRIVLDQSGAELLLGQGDMLFLSPRTSKLMRSQGTLVDDMEIRRTVKFLKKVAQANYEPALVQMKSGGVEDVQDRDELFEQAVEIVLETRRGSVSLLQRRLSIGYARASRLIEQMAEGGILGEYKGSQAREVNVTPEEWEAIKAQISRDNADGILQDQAGDSDDSVPDEMDDEYQA